MDPNDATDVLREVVNVEQAACNGAVKLKAPLRDAAARTTDVLWATVAAPSPAFPPAECVRYFARCGYGVTTRSPSGPVHQTLPRSSERTT